MGDRSESIRIDDDVINGLIQANAPAHVIDAARLKSDKSNSQHCEVWRENWLSVLFFLKVDTQWIISPMGGYVGLNYESIKSMMWMREMKRKTRVRIMNDLGIIEDKILTIQAERSRKQ